MEVKVKYLPPLSMIAGKQTEDITVPEGCTVEDLLSTLVNKYGGRFKRNIYPDGNEQAGRYLINFTRNGEIIKPEDVLSVGDKVILFMTLGGG